MNGDFSPDPTNTKRNCNLDTVVGERIIPSHTHRNALLQLNVQERSYHLLVVGSEYSNAWRDVLFPIFSQDLAKCYHVEKGQYSSEESKCHMMTGITLIVTNWIVNTKLDRFLKCLLFVG